MTHVDGGFVIPQRRVTTMAHLLDWLLTHTIIDRKLDHIMADLTALSAAADQISTDVGEAVTALQDLAAKLAEAGDTTSQAEVDAVVAKLTSAGQTLDDAVATNDPPAPPAE